MTTSTADVSKGPPAADNSYVLSPRYVELVIVPGEPDEGGFCGFVPMLPGVISEGDDPFEAFSTLKSCLIEVLQIYKKGGKPVPWRLRPDPPPEGHQSQWFDLASD